MVQADAYGRAMLLANGNEPGELLPCLLMVGMEVAGIDADLIHEGRDRKGRLGGEMDIRHDRDPDSLFTERTTDIPDGRDLFLSGDGDADDIRPRGSHPAALGERRP